MTIDEFVNTTNAKGYDVDGVYGAQCVDGFKLFANMMLGQSCNFGCGNGWAYGFWTCYDTNGVANYFNKHPYNEATKGDWIIWNNGSTDCPYSHVGMFVYRESNGRVMTYGQNQLDKHYFTNCSISEQGILGVLRLKILEPQPAPTINYIGTPVNRDENKDQIQVNVTNLYVRDNPSGNIKGFINLGIYDIKDKQNANGYDWYNIGIGWIAFNNAWETILNKVVPQPAPAPVPTPVPTPTPTPTPTPDLIPIDIPTEPIPIITPIDIPKINESTSEIVQPTNWIKGLINWIISIFKKD